MKFLLDTDHLSILQLKDGLEFKCIVARLDELDPDDYGISIVTFHEQMIGCHGSINKAKSDDAIVLGYARLARIISDYTLADVVPFDDVAAATFRQLRKGGVRIGAMDLRIAAIALSRHLTVVTRNTVDFSKVPGLNLEDWTL